MAEYSIPEFTLEQRGDVALQMLIPLPDRKWGLVSELARLHSVSRTLLYEIRDRASDAIVEALLPRDAGRPAQGTTLMVNKAFIDRTIAILLESGENWLCRVLAEFVSPKACSWREILPPAAPGSGFLGRCLPQKQFRQSPVSSLC